MGVCVCVGMNKMVINHLERLFVTSDASTIVTELEVNHPAARLLVHAAKAQEQEIGDGTNMVGGHRHGQLPFSVHAHAQPTFKASTMLGMIPGICSCF